MRGILLEGIPNSKDGENSPRLIDKLKIQCFRGTAGIPQCLTQGSRGYNISATCNYVILAQGKNLVQTVLTISLPLGIYARIALCSGLEINKFVDVGIGVIENGYKGEIGIVLFNHSTENFHIQVGENIAQLILEKIKILIVPNIKVLSTI